MRTEVKSTLIGDLAADLRVSAWWGSLRKDAGNAAFW
jgi:hypothetical protein